jgi:hypothetical protein
LPEIPVPPGAVAVSGAAFAEQWNAAVQGTTVSQITQSDVRTFKDGPTATTFLVELSDDVGLLGVVRKSDGSVAEVIEVWVPGGTEPAGSQLFRDAFDVLLRTLNPDLDQAGRVAVAAQLGVTPSTPPFPAGTTATATAPPNRYGSFTRMTDDYGEVSAINVVDGRPR